MADRPWVVVAGGGTAGHLLPGLAVADALVAAGRPQRDVLFVGAKRGLEATLLPPTGYPVVLLPGRGIARRLTLDNVGAVLGLLRAFAQAVVLLVRRRPRVVLALGGYASVACSVGAVLLRIPLVVAEQNARAGLANAVVGRFARACAVAFEDTDLPHAVLTGNPVRPEVLAVDRRRDRAEARRALDIDQDRILVAAFSGSLGSARINAAVRGAAVLLADRDDLAIRHVVGSRDWDAAGGDAGALPAGAALEYQAVRYEDAMARLLAAADLVVCRSGGTTVAELAAVGVASILVPLPIAPRDHQRANAAALVAAGAALLVDDAALDADELARRLRELVDEPGRLDAMGAAAAGLGRPHAARAVADLLEEHAR